MRFVLLGNPVAHSLSPRLHNAALAAAGIAGTYSARRVDASAFHAAVAELRSGKLTGANVTMPHKARAHAAADRHDAAAAAAGAVNTLFMTGDGLMGCNTDVTGVRRVWADAGFPDRGPVLVLGAGGAAAGVLVALRDHDLCITARNPDAAARLLDRIGVAAEIVPWGEGRPAVVINATPLGMAGEGLPPGIMDAAGGFIDLAYGPTPTPAVAEARRRLLPAVDGIGVLIAQAAAAFELWTGKPAPVDAMRGAVAAA